MNNLNINSKTTPLHFRQSLHRSLRRHNLGAVPLIFTILGLCGLAQLSNAQCPQTCDINENTALGLGALANHPTGYGNTATGYNALSYNTTGSSNTGTGFGALVVNTTGFNNTATGVSALQSNSTASFNTGTGAGALQYNTTGQNNTANGYEALYGVSGSSTGGNNTATGNQALFSNTTGYDNTAGGSLALYHNTTGTENTGTGLTALYSNTTGYNNTATGSGALYSSTTGANNEASGASSLYSNTTGGNNLASGFSALMANTTGSNNTAVGANALVGNTTGGNNIALGQSAGENLTIGNNNIDIGNGGVQDESNAIRIGTAGTQTATFIAGIRGVGITGAQPVGVNANGQLGVRVSSVRFKEAIKPMDKASEAILSLQPVSFRYKKALDPKGTPEFGLIAEEVAKVNSDLVTTDEQGKPFTVRYDEVNAMLLNEFLKAHRKLEEQAQVNQAQEAINADLRSTLARQQALITEQRKEIKALSAGMEKLSARLESSQATARLVTTND